MDREGTIFFTTVISSKNYSHNSAYIVTPSNHCPGRDGLRIDHSLFISITTMFFVLSRDKVVQLIGGGWFSFRCRLLAIKWVNIRPTTIKIYGSKITRNVTT